MFRSLAMAVALCAVLAGCQDRSEPTAELALTVAPLGLSDVTNARYTITVATVNGVVWTKTIDADHFGNGQGALAYVGPCDASTPAHTVTLTLDALYDASGAITDFENPTPVTQTATCVASTDTPVRFDLTVMRRAEQGFFDVAVQFEDIFCSAKLDCQEPDGSDLELLHHGDARDMTVVLGFACASGNASTWLYLDDLVIDCAGSATDVRVAPTGLGNTTIDANPNGYLFGAATYRGVETNGVAFWNAALGLDEAAFATMGACVLRTRGTASSEPWPQVPAGFEVPSGAIYPVVSWEVPLSDAGGRVCTSHPLNGGNGVTIAYRGFMAGASGGPWGASPVRFQHRLQPNPAGGILVSAGAPICNPGCVNGACVANGDVNTCECAAGWSGPVCDAAVCASPCTHGGACVAPDVCDCAGTGWTGETCAADVDECALDNGGCDAAATCTNTPGGRACACDDGWFGDGLACAACSAVSGCVGAVTCTDEDDSLCSACASGYAQASAGAACVNVDECALGSDACAADATCTDTDGAYACACNEGWYGDGFACAACSGVAQCVGALTCTTASDSVCGACASGYAQASAGAACVNVDECASNLDDCAASATCTDTEGGFACACNAGTYGDGVTCAACGAVAQCVGAVTCTSASDSVCGACASGYAQAGAGAACVNVDECALNIDNCAASATCTDTAGAFGCSCNPGFSGNGVMCSACPAGQVQPLSGQSSCDACAAGTYDDGDEVCGTCAAVAQCMGAVTCTSASDSVCGACASGYAQAGPGAACVNVDECASNIDDCAASATCSDTPGSFTCACNPGTFGNGVSCTACPNGQVQPLAGQSSCNACAAGTYDDGDEVCGVCSAVAQCTGAVTCTSASDSVCGACASGYAQASAGAACVNVDECALNIDDCAASATCSDTPGSFTCACNPGTFGDGVSCTACPNGQVQPLSGQSSCNACAAGTYDDGDEVCGTCSAITQCVGTVTCTSASDSLCSQCASGYAQASAGAACVNVNECTLDTDNCAASATCTDTPGSFTCACNPGTFGNGVSCTACPNGQVQPLAGQASCNACTSGTYDDGDEVCGTCTAVSHCGGSLTCSNASNSVCSACDTGYAQASAGAACSDIDGCAGDPCSGVTCYDVAAPGTGFQCAAPDPTSLLSCSPATITIGQTSTCTITPRMNSQVITARATSFTPSASVGNVSIITPALGSSLTFTFSPTYAGTITIGSGKSTTQVTVNHITNAGTTAALAGFDCADLLADGVITSGVYWINPSNGTSANAFQVYCEQQQFGGGWTLLYNSVGDPAGQTRAFWGISYAQRFDRKGTPAIDANFYEPSLYDYGRNYLDVAVDMSGTTRELFRATAWGIDASTMRMLTPALVSGSNAIYNYQFASGWSSSDYDGDNSTAQCGQLYFGAQHYRDCWYYSLASDADTPFEDSGWGPHMENGTLTSVGLATQSGGGTHSRVQRISRFVKLCDGCTPTTTAWDCAELYEDGQTATGTYWIQPGTPAPIKSYCEGGWTMLYNSVGRLDGPTRAFWQIPYADRFTKKGVASTTTNYYDAALYLEGGLYLDVVADLAGTRADMFQASADGIDTTTMAMLSPALVSTSVPGNVSEFYNQQFAAGWSAVDQDYDTLSTGSCGQLYPATQHYANCWAYNLGVDADNPVFDSDWGPHVYRSGGVAMGLSLTSDNYPRVGRITRFTKPGTATSCLQWKQRGFDTSGLYLLDTDDGGPATPFLAYCDQQSQGGGWTLVSNRVPNTVNVESCGTELREFFHQSAGCGSVTALSPTASYALPPTRRTALPRTEMMMTQYLDGALDSDDLYIVTIPAGTGDLFPNTEVLTDFPMTKVCTANNATCDTTDVYWRYIGDYWYASSLCNTGIDMREEYSGNYGLCHNGLSTAYSSSTFAGDRGGYDETKLWAHPNNAAQYSERIWYR